MNLPLVKNSVKNYKSGSISARKRLALVAAICLFSFCVFSGCQLMDKKEGDNVEAFDLETKGIDYQVYWQDTPDNIVEILIPESVLYKLNKRPPVSLAGLIKRCKNDRKIYRKVLANFGYFSPKIDMFIFPDGDPFLIKTNIDPGTRYKIGKISFKCEDSTKLLSMANDFVLLDVVNVKVGDNVNLTEIADSCALVKEHLALWGYPFAELMEPDCHIDHEDQVVNVVFRFNSGGIGIFDKVEIVNLKNLPEEYIKNRLLWQKGSVYRQNKVDKSRRKLLETGLFSNISIEPVNSSANTKTVSTKSSKEIKNKQPVTVRVKVNEGLKRVFGVGARYSTSDGIGGNIFWRHANIGGLGHSLQTKLRASTKKIDTSVSYYIPDFYSPLQTLKNKIFFLYQKTDAYKERTFGAEVSIQRPINEELKAEIGVVYENSKSEKGADTYKSSIFGFPIDMEIDTTNSILDPTRGMRANLGCTPYFGKMRSGSSMVILSGKYSFYLPLISDQKKDAKLVVAAFVKVGTILNQSFNDIQPEKRFYSGGVGSVRGYGFQKIGNFDADKHPLGGKSLTEAGIELRFKVSQDVSLVTFFEGGSVNQDLIPKFFKGMHFGAGVGVRYHTKFGPIRLDVALPLKRRQFPDGTKIDGLVQFYLSIGQAF